MPGFTGLERISTETIAHLLSPIHLRWRTASPWAVILVKFNDDPHADPDRTIYEHLFTSAGSGTDNMPAFFEDMSHGRLDLSGSRVFGWYTLNRPRTDYVGNVYPAPAGKLNRNGLVDAARAVATADGVDLGKFSGVVVSAYGSTDLCGWMGGMAALCDQNSLQPSLLGQEMGHGYGLDHARLEGLTADYQDPWDTMSTAAFPWNEDPDPNYTLVGPGLNAWEMRSRGWLDDGRVWGTTGNVDATVVLRPLHWRELSGYLAAQVGPYLVEFRVPERWDAGIDEAVVLVHRFDDNHSYLMPGTRGEQGLTRGSAFVAGREDWAYVDYVRIEVADIDPHSHTATIHVQGRKAIPFPHYYEGVAKILGGIPVDGDGIIVLPGGRIIKVPPRGPLVALLEQVAAYAETTVSGDVALAIASRRSALASIAASAEALLEENEIVTHGPVRMDVEKQEWDHDRKVAWTRERTQRHTD